MHTCPDQTRPSKTHADQTIENARRGGQRGRHACSGMFRSRLPKLCHKGDCMFSRPLESTLRFLTYIHRWTSLLSRQLVPPPRICCFGHWLQASTRVLSMKTRSPLEVEEWKWEWNIRIRFVEPEFAKRQSPRSQTVIQGSTPYQNTMNTKHIKPNATSYIIRIYKLISIPERVVRFMSFDLGLSILAAIMWNRRL